MRGNRHREGHRYQEREREAQPPGVDAHGPSPRLVHALEDHQDVLDAHQPEGGGGQDNPEAVHDQAAGGRGGHEERRLRGSYMRAHADERHGQDAHAEDNVREAPDLHALDAHQELRVLGLGEREIQRAPPHRFDELLEAGLDHHPDPAPDEEEHPNEPEDLVGRPAAEGRGVGEDHREPGHGRSELHDRFEKLYEEVCPVRELAHDADAEEGPEEPEIPHAPTAE